MRSIPRILLAALLAAASVACTHTPAAPAATAAPAPAPDPDELIVQTLKRFGVPGAAVSVVKDGQVVLAKGYGVRELGKPTPVDADTLFGMASNTKPFTAVAVAMLVQDGKLAWEDPVVKHLGGFAVADPHLTSRIELRDLLSHRVGHATFAGDVLWIHSTYDRAEVLRRLPGVPLAFPFRGGFGYSNLMFTVAGEVVHAASGKRWEDFLRERLTGPLGMSRTVFTVEQVKRMDNVAAYHTRAPDGLKVIEPRVIDAAAPAAGMSSSANDMARWLLFQTGRGLVDGQRIAPEALFDDVWTPHSLLRLPPGPLRRKLGQHFSAYTLGWFARDHRGHFVVGHGGGIPGMFSQTAVAPDAGVGVSVLTNSDEHPAQAILASALLDLYLGLPPLPLPEPGADEEPPAPPAATATSTPVDAKTLGGTYRSELYGDARISVEQGRAVLHLSAHPDLTCPLEPQSKELVRCAWSLPEFAVSTLRFEGEGTKRRFTVAFRPEYIDALDYTFRYVGP